MFIDGPRRTRERAKPTSVRSGFPIIPSSMSILIVPTTEDEANSFAQDTKRKTPRWSKPAKTAQAQAQGPTEVHPQVFNRESTSTARIRSSILTPSSNKGAPPSIADTIPMITSVLLAIQTTNSRRNPAEELEFPSERRSIVPYDRSLHGLHQGNR